MVLSIFNFNYYYGDSPNEVSLLSILAFLVSIVSIFFSIKLVYISKKIELRHRKFEDLCLNPVKDGLKEIIQEIENNGSSLLSNQVNKIKIHQREFTILLTRLRRVYKDIDASLIQDRYLDFIDFCTSQPESTYSSFIINKFKTLELEIINDIYKFATDKSIYR
jgi:hypothetical protein